MAMRPFIGYHVGDYLPHWLKIGRTTSESNLPRIFYVNWFRKVPRASSSGPASATTPAS